MAEARGRLEWSQTSEILAMLYNVNRDKSTPPLTATAFFPYPTESPTERPAGTVSAKTAGQMMKGARHAIHRSN